MSYFGKKYVLASQENMEGFINAFGEQEKQGIINYKPSFTISKDGDNYTITTSKPGGEKVFNFKSGVEFADKFHDMEVKITITVNGNTVTEMQKGSNGVSYTVKREFTDDQIVATMTSSVWDGVAKRVYKAA